MPDSNMSLRSLMVGHPDYHREDAGSIPCRLQFGLNGEPMHWSACPECMAMRGSRHQDGCGAITMGGCDHHA